MTEIHLYADKTYWLQRYKLGQKDKIPSAAGILAGMLKQVLLPVTFRAASASKSVSMAFLHVAQVFTLVPRKNMFSEVYFRRRRAVQLHP